MASYFRNPANSYVEKATSSWTWLWALLFGPFFFIYKGAWAVSFVYFLCLLFLTGGQAGIIVAIALWIIFAAVATPVVRKVYLRRGWVDASPSSSGARRA